MIVQQRVLPFGNDSEVSPESFYEFFKELNNFRTTLGIKNISLVFFVVKKNITIIHCVVEIETTLETLFAFQYGLLKIWAAPTATIQAIDKIFGPQLENWSSKSDLRYQNLISDKRVDRVQYTIGQNGEDEIICYKGKTIRVYDFLDSVDLKILIKIMGERLK